jgi:ribonuclease HI
LKQKFLLWLKKMEKTLGTSDAIEELRAQVQQLPQAESAAEKELPPPQEIQDEGEDAVALFADGACRGNPGPGAWAYVIQDKKGQVLGEQKGFESQTTNNRMELIGAIRGLSAALTYQKHSKVMFLSDSKYVIEGLRQWLPAWKERGWKKADGKAPENVDLWQEIDQLKISFPHLDLKWVKGHAGHPQNEYCDWLCNQALDDVDPL